MTHSCSMSLAPEHSQVDGQTKALVPRDIPGIVKKMSVVAEEGMRLWCKHTCKKKMMQNGYDSETHERCTCAAKGYEISTCGRHTGIKTHECKMAEHL